ncbi:MAG: Rv3235 family protein [Micromonosporaceae bacterium]
MVSLFALPDPAPRYDDEPPPATPGQAEIAVGAGGPHHVLNHEGPGRARTAAPPRAAGRTEAPSEVPGRLGGEEAGDVIGGRGPVGAGDAGPGYVAAASLEPGHGQPRRPKPSSRRNHQAKPMLGGPHAGPAWPNVFAQVLAETLAGSRPTRQLSPWTTERARGHIRRLGPLLRTSGGSPGSGPEAVAVSGKRPISSRQPRIRRVVASMPSTGVVEMAVIVGFGPRVRALAVRLEHPEGREWLCTAIEAA